MKTFIEFLTEAKGLKKLIRSHNKPKKGTKEAQEKFAMRQAVRAANKYASGQTIKAKGMTREVPSHIAIGAQFGVDVQPDASGQYGSSTYTPTEDKALSGNLKSDRQAQDIFRKTFMKRFSQIHQRSLGSY